MGFVPPQSGGMFVSVKNWKHPDIRRFFVKENNKRSLFDFGKLVKEKSLQIFFSKCCFFCGKILSIEKYAASRFFTEEIKICRCCLADLPLRLPFDRVLKDSINIFEQEISFFIYTPFFYERQMIRLLRQLKFDDGIFLSKPIGFFMAMIVLEYKLEVDVILPIPLSGKRQRERGYNQAFLLARELGRWVGKPVVSDCLLRVRETKRQSEIDDPIERKMNVEGAFSISGLWDIEGLRCLIVDDIFTTGATMISVAHLLKKAGAFCVIGIAAASGRIGQMTGIISKPDVQGIHVFEPS